MTSDGQRKSVILIVNSTGIGVAQGSAAAVGVFNSPKAGIGLGGNAIIGPDGKTQQTSKSLQITNNKIISQDD